MGFSYGAQFFFYAEVNLPSPVIVSVISLGSSLAAENFFPKPANLIISPPHSPSCYRSSSRKLSIDDEEDGEFPRLWFGVVGVWLVWFVFFLVLWFFFPEYHDGNLLLSVHQSFPTLPAYHSTWECANFFEPPGIT